MLTKMALAALVGTVGVGVLATPASAQERGFGRGGFARGRVEHVERERGFDHGFGRGRGYEYGRRGWEHARYGYAPVGRGYYR
jgi:hypothetical protein